MGAPERALIDEQQYLAREAREAQRHEYVAGIVYAMAGAGERHNRIALNLAVALRMAARGTPCGVYVADMKLRVAHAASYYYPDVMVSCEPASPDTAVKEHPCLLAEVLSPATAAIDTREKLLAYRGIASLRYYVIVDSERPAVAYYVRGADGQWLAANLEPGERLDVRCEHVNAVLTLAAIYEDTGLAVG